MGRSIRFLADENFQQQIVDGLRLKAPAMDILTVTEAGIKGLPDPDLLVFAADQNRILLSHDLATMPAHLTHYMVSGRHSPGIFLMHQFLAIGTAIQELPLVWEASDPEEWHDRWAHLPL